MATLTRPTAAPVTLPVLSWDRLALVTMTMLGVLYGLAVVAGEAPIPGDARIYWVSTPGAYSSPDYVYPPPLSQLLEPLRAAHAWAPFIVAWMTLCFASLGYVLGRWAFLAVALVVPDIALGGGHWWAGPIEAVLLGNVTLPMVAAIILGLTRPGWFAVPLLTKITPGVGLLWFACRQEWRAVAIGAAVTGTIAGVSFVLDPAAWFAFAGFALDHAGARDVAGLAIWGPPLAVRLPIAVLLVAVGSRTNRPWLVPIAAAVALVGLYGPATFASVAGGALYWFRPQSRQPGAAGSAGAQAATSAPRLIAKGAAATTDTSSVAIAPSSRRVAVRVTAPAETPIA